MSTDSDKAVVKKITAPSDGQISTMTEWLHDWWGKSEGYSGEAVRSYLSNSFHSDRYPQTYGLFLGEKLIGMFQITMSDLFVRPDLYPWLANVYIDEKYRGLGYGKFLLENIGNILKDHSCIDEIYLYTTHENLYERFGWEFVEKTDTFLSDRIQNIYRLRI